MGCLPVVTTVLLCLVAAATAASSAFYDLGHPCNRPCNEGSQPMVCYFRFTVEWYYTLSKACYDCPFNVSDCSRPHCIAANGVEKAILVANRMLPGPKIEVCENDTIVVDVENRAGSETTTIHWHGMHQVDTPYMDGVPMVTQCPILPHNTFRYEFRASPAGTHFWHSHSGLQRSDGLHGMLVVRQAATRDPHYDLYDHDLSEHSMLVTDWLSEPSIDRFVSHHHQNGTNKPQSILVNGLGRFQELFDPTTNETTFTPVEVFYVQRGARYRFRIVSNGIMNCPIQVSVDNHTLMVIATDGQPVKPLPVDSLVIYAGERFDFVLHANQDVGNYLVRFRGLLDCDERFLRASQVAVLRYHGAQPVKLSSYGLDYSDMSRNGTLLNALNSGTVDDQLSVVEMVSLLPDDETSKDEADVKFYLPFDFAILDNKHFHHHDFYPVHGVQRNRQLYTPQINNISFVAPSAPLLTQPWLTSATLCNHTHLRHGCDADYCECTYALHVPLGAVVELVLIDKGFVFDANHPFHLHGTSFRVLAMDRVGKNVTLEEVMRLESQGKIKRRLKGAVVKDTVTVPDGGYTVVRFVASNPGYWMLHCHIEFHMEIGMALIFIVGDQKNIKSAPPHFPTCGNWLRAYDSSSADATVAWTLLVVVCLTLGQCHILAADAATVGTEPHPNTRATSNTRTTKTDLTDSKCFASEIRDPVAAETSHFAHYIRDV